MFCGLIILNCTIKTRRIYFCAATQGITPKISFTLVLLVHVPYPTFPQLSSFKSFCYFIFPFFAIIRTVIKIKLKFAKNYLYQQLVYTNQKIIVKCLRSDSCCTMCCSYNSCCRRQNVVCKQYVSDALFNLGSIAKELVRS